MRVPQKSSIPEEIIDYVRLNYTGTKQSQVDIAGRLNIKPERVRYIICKWGFALNRHPGKKRWTAKDVERLEMLAEHYTEEEAANIMNMPYGTLHSIVTYKKIYWCKRRTWYNAKEFAYMIRRPHQFVQRLIETKLLNASLHGNGDRPSGHRCWKITRESAKEFILHYPLELGSGCDMVQILDIVTDGEFMSYQAKRQDIEKKLLTKGYHFTHNVVSAEQVKKAMERTDVKVKLVYIGKAYKVFVK